MQVSSPSVPMSADTHSSTEDSIPDVVVNSDSDVRKVRRSLQNEDGPYKRLSTSLKIDTSSDHSSGSNGGEGRGFTQSENDIESHKIHQNYLVCINYIFLRASKCRFETLKDYSV